MLDRRHLFGAAATAAAAATALPAIAQAQAPAASATKSRLLSVQETNVLRVGTTGDFNPMSFRDPASNELRGHQIDAARQFAKDLGVELRFVPTDWRTLVAGITSNQFDIVFTGTSMSVARAKAIAFTDTWGTNAFVPLARKADAAKFKDWSDLNRKDVTIGYNLGTTFEQFVQQDLPNATARRVESPARDWQELIAGRVDVTISSLIEAAFLTKEYPQIVKLFPEKPRNAIPMSFITPIDDIVWLNFVNNWIRIRKAAGFFDEIAQKWNLVTAA